eukprot:Awhi_evm1s15204
MLFSGEKAEALDTINKKKLYSWIEGQVVKFEAKNANLDSKDVAKYKAKLERTVAQKIYEFQTKRNLNVSTGNAAVEETTRTTTVKGELDFNWVLPPGLDYHSSEDVGRTLVATRNFEKDDVVLTEQCGLVVVLPKDAVGVFTDEILKNSQKDAKTRDIKRKVLQAQIDCFSQADEITRAKILCLHQAKSLSDSIDDDLVEELFKGCSSNKVVPDTKIRTSDGKEVIITGKEAVRLVPLIFLGCSIQESSNVICLPILGSLVNHSCDANTLRQFKTTEVQGENGKMEKCLLVEYIARKPIQEGDDISISYLGASLLPTSVRQSLLFNSKNLSCRCDRCIKTPEREACLVCPTCFPLSKRDNGFVVQYTDDDASDFGYICRQPDKDSWACNRCKQEFTTSEMENDFKLPDGAPAANYLALNQYINKLGEELSNLDNDPAVLFSQNAMTLSMQYYNAIRITAGRNNWASQMWILKLCQGVTNFSIQKVDANILTQEKQNQLTKHVLESFPELWDWVETYLELDPVIFIGPQVCLTIIQLYKKHGGNDTKELTDVYTRALRTCVPTFSDMAIAVDDILYA